MAETSTVRSASIGILVLPVVKDALEAAAKSDRRSVASYIETVLVAELERTGFLPKGAAE